jgi:hypothetical protein
LRDGRTELTFTPIDFLRRLATMIPPPRRHCTRYHGVFAPTTISAPLSCTLPLPITPILSLAVGSPGPIYSTSMSAGSGSR